MASVWFSLCVLLAIQQVFARDCSKLENINNCDECIRCGGTWCNTPDVKIRCSLTNDEFCPLGREELLKIDRDPASHEPIDLVTSSPDELVHLHRTVLVTSPVSNEFIYPGTKEQSRKPDVSFENSTVIKLNPDNYLSFFDVTKKKFKFDEDYDGYKSTIQVMPTTEFCPNDGTNSEFITLRLQASSSGESEKYALASYHVPCACECSSKVEKKSSKCSGNGDFSCGICKCEKGWKGESCKEKDTTPNIPNIPNIVFKPNLPNVPNCDRGDISGACLQPITGLVCSNNGRCTCDGTCECSTDIDGSQYFDEHCTDICTRSSYCDDCLLHPTNGRCQYCHYPMYMEPLNNTILNDTDALGKKIWISCVEKNDSCNIEYAAMRDAKGDTYIMITDYCKTIAGGQILPGSVNVTMPVILGVIALVAAAAAVAGYVFMKNRPPGMQTVDAGYQNIDAVESAGVNPLYKPPTSHYKNPTFGKL